MHHLPSAPATCAPASGGAPKSRPIPFPSHACWTPGQAEQGQVAGKGLQGQPAAGAGDTAPHHGLGSDGCSGADVITIR